MVIPSKRNKNQQGRRTSEECEKETEVGFKEWSESKHNIKAD